MKANLSQKEIDPKTIEDEARFSHSVSKLGFRAPSRGINLINFHQRRLESRILVEFEEREGKKETRRRLQALRGRDIQRGRGGKFSDAFPLIDPDEKSALKEIKIGPRRRCEMQPSDLRSRFQRFLIIPSILYICVCVCLRIAMLN